MFSPFPDSPIEKKKLVLPQTHPHPLFYYWEDRQLQLGIWLSSPPLQSLPLSEGFSYLLCIVGEHGWKEEENPSLARFLSEVRAWVLFSALFRLHTAIQGTSKCRV